MLAVQSISAGGSSAAVGAYYEGYQLGKEDPNTRSHDEPAGVWMGDYARELGLEGNVQRGDIAKLFQGYHPRTDESLANNAGPEHKPGHDLTFNAPKSVSIVWATADQNRQKAISDAHKRSVQKALNEAVRCRAIYQREGKGGSYKVPLNGGYVVALFEHSSSRTNDAHLHSHAVLFNIAANKKSVTFDTSYTHMLGAVYRAHFARELREMGFDIEMEKTSFAIKGVDKKMERELSKRADQIQREAERSGLKSAAAKDVHALASRVAKTECPRAAAFESAKRVASEYGFDPENIRVEDPKPEAFDLGKLCDENFTQISTLTDLQLKTRIIQNAQISDADIDSVDQIISEAVQSGDLVQLTDTKGVTRYTTTEVMDMEQTIVDRGVSMHESESQTHVDPEIVKEVAARNGLREEQALAALHMTDNQRISVVQGLAGAGKSFTLNTAREIWESEGNAVMGCALQGKVAVAMTKDAGIPSSTIAKLVIDLENGNVQFNERTVLVIDEAGMVGSRQMSVILKAAQESGAKLVMVGDTSQLQPIDAGAPMRAIKRRIGAFVMKDIVRQSNKFDRVTSLKLAQGKIDEAVGRMRERNQIVRHKSSEEAKRSVAAKLTEVMNKTHEDGRRFTSVAMADTLKDTDFVNMVAREQARSVGLVKGEEYEFSATRGERLFSVGDRVLFQRNNSQMKVSNGTLGTVVEARTGSVLVQVDGGDQVLVRGSEYSDIDYGYCFTVHKSQGVTADAGFYLPGSMASRQALYVAGTRHKMDFELHVTEDQDGIDELGQSVLVDLFSRDDTKLSSTDVALARESDELEEEAQAEREGNDQQEEQEEHDNEDSHDREAASERVDDLNSELEALQREIEADARKRDGQGSEGDAADAAKGNDVDVGAMSGLAEAREQDRRAEENRRQDERKRDDARKQEDGKQQSAIDRLRQIAAETAAREAAKDADRRQEDARQEDARREDARREDERRDDERRNDRPDVRDEDRSVAELLAEAKKLEAEIRRIEEKGIDKLADEKLDGVANEFAQDGRGKMSAATRAELGLSDKDFMAFIEHEKKAAAEFLERHREELKAELKEVKELQPDAQQKEQQDQQEREQTEAQLYEEAEREAVERAQENGENLYEMDDAERQAAIEQEAEKLREKQAAAKAAEQKRDNAPKALKDMTDEERRERLIEAQRQMQREAAERAEAARQRDGNGYSR